MVLVERGGVYATTAGAGHRSPVSCVYREKYTMIAENVKPIGDLTPADPQTKVLNGNSIIEAHMNGLFKTIVIPLTRQRALTGRAIEKLRLIMQRRVNCKARHMMIVRIFHS